MEKKSHPLPINPFCMPSAMISSASDEEKELNASRLMIIIAFLCCVLQKQNKKLGTLDVILVFHFLERVHKVDDGRG